MVALKVFEGPLCCNTGVCGPDPEQALVDFTADARWLAGQGINVTRANLAQDPAAFAADAAARTFVQLAGADALPLVLVDGTTVLTGRYPSRAELARFTGLTTPESAPAAATDSSCCGAEDQPSGCCSSAPQVLQISAPVRSCC
ncbi:arsenite efflux transporter metallochaperone ArsD [Raineyella sp. W15-4]|uniref:arsenite efflux transporter metallochaperone ArsD n=1 Tax=Raineyella sp. W15-4 TaxID=3081651 RepID=UPI002953125F|nr:arsenite efflux transporter metallochaperone ArsD [Raineyella sp. W15-4]WOQ16902.1 arsenite efflux transporter metallochaperone ArsD [Raineyella sp. W15-4]